MNEEFTREEVKKAIEQAEANLELEEVSLQELEKENKEEHQIKKVLKK